MAAKIQRQEEFEGVLLNVIEEDGVKWFTSEDVGKGMGFAEPRKGVLKIFERHKDEFEGKSRVVTLGIPTSTGGLRPHRIRVFNAEGAVMVGFFGITPRAKAFRHWLSQFLAHDMEKLKAHVLKLEAANRKLLAKSRQKALPGPEYGHKDQIKKLENTLKETKKAANELIDMRDKRIGQLHGELAQVQQQAKIRPLLLEGRHRRLQRHLFKMIEELGSFRAIIVELAEHLQEK